MTADTTFNRSEKIRQRRNVRSQERVVRATNVIRTPRSTSNPTVTVRGRGMGRPILSQSSSQTRRKYYVSLDASGTELSMPALPMIRPGWRLLSGMIVIAMVVLMILVGVAIGLGWDRKFQTAILSAFPGYGAGITAIENTGAVQNALSARQAKRPSRVWNCQGRPPVYWEDCFRCSGSRAVLTGCESRCARESASIRMPSAYSWLAL